MGEEGLTCPSARCEAGATLLGIVTGDGTVAYLSPPLQIDQAFVDRAAEGRPPEQRFRFAAPCVESGCGRWTGSRCEVIDAVATAEVEPPAELPQCSIRSSCRWFAQSGRDACGVCPLVLTESPR